MRSHNFQIGRDTPLANPIFWREWIIPFFDHNVLPTNGAQRPYMMRKTRSDDAAEARRADIVRHSRHWRNG
jgi:hypothetical protein